MSVFDLKGGPGHRYLYDEEVDKPVNKTIKHNKESSEKLSIIYFENEALTDYVGEHNKKDIIDNYRKKIDNGLSKIKMCPLCNSNNITHNNDYTTLTCIDCNCTIKKEKKQ